MLSFLSLVLATVILFLQRTPVQRRLLMFTLMLMVTHYLGICFSENSFILPSLVKKFAKYRFIGELLGEGLVDVIFYVEKSNI